MARTSRRLNKKRVLGALILSCIIFFVISAITSITSKENVKIEPVVFASETEELCIEPPTTEVVTLSNIIPVEEISVSTTQDATGNMPVDVRGNYIVAWEYLNLRMTPEISESNTFLMLKQGDVVTQVNNQACYDDESKLTWIFVQVKDVATFEGDKTSITGWISIQGLDKIR